MRIQARSIIPGPLSAEFHWVSLDVGNHSNRDRNLGGRRQPLVVAQALRWSKREERK
jgi:hypothetical protein